MSAMPDYRLSHQGAAKAASYHRRFRENPYRAMMWELEQEILDRILIRFLPSRSLRHLDFACGTGRILSYLRQKVTQCVGIDVSESMLDIARDELKDCSLICADITKDGVLNDQKFDLVTAFRFFPNAQDALRNEAMAALARRLDDDGVLVFNNHKNRSSLIYRLGRVLRRGNDRRDMSIREAESLARQAGLEVIATYHVGAFPSTEGVRLLPSGLLGWLERRISRIPAAAKLSSNVVFVCRRAPSAPAEGE